MKIRKIVIKPNVRHGVNFNWHQETIDDSGWSLSRISRDRDDLQLRWDSAINHSFLSHRRRFLPFLHCSFRYDEGAKLIAIFD